MTMAEIGSWGTFTFYVSRSSIKTFDDLKWESSVKYATHERHLKEPLLEFTGQDGESTKLSNSLQRYDRGGNLLAASVNVTMQSYSSR